MGEGGEEVPDEDVVEREQTGEIVIVDDLGASISKEVRRLLFIDIEPHCSQVP